MIGYSVGWNGVGEQGGGKDLGSSMRVWGCRRGKLLAIQMGLGA